ncbi:hypothetical protein APT98_05550 [Klebsiella quasipneumoniae]|nr:hypothetical protein APT98_05550 [Klebsiella quasipneumoniae]
MGWRGSGRARTGKMTGIKKPAFAGFFYKATTSGD